ncbi:MAG: GntR family transcriptional regulator [Rhodobacteraceae bacterium]|nr:GntR family transcriptional regulator [Paracoccaceae bacterium]
MSKNDSRAVPKASNGKTHAIRALLDLRQRILAGQLPGGTRLYEVAMAEELNISRTPLREAMSRLTEEGLLERAMGGGFVVRSFGYADVADAIELRGVLEGMAARLAAERGVSAQNMAPLEQIVVDLDNCFETDGELIDFERYSELNEAFHNSIARLAGSAIVIRELERAKSLPFASPSAFLPDKADIQNFRRSLIIAQEHHRGLVDAIKAREGSRAEMIAREHARIARKNLDYILMQGGDLASHMPSLALVVE